MKELLKICGTTPLVKITDRIYGKLETFNPSGSVKDRMVSYVVDRALSRKEIDENTVLCDATSGNTGIALSMIAANLGLKCVIFMPANMSEERKQMMRVYGSLIVEAPDDDFARAIEMRDEYLSSHPGSWSPMQFSNPDNVECHKNITGPEILRDVCSIDRKWGAFIHGSGTGGTIEGVRQFITVGDLNTKVVMVQPAESPHGIQGIADGKEFLAKDADMDEIITISTEAAIDRARAFARETGLLVGISAGANIAASEIWESRNPGSSCIVTMLCDRGERYMSIY